MIGSGLISIIVAFFLMNWHTVLLAQPVSSIVPTTNIVSHALYFSSKSVILQFS